MIRDVPRNVFTLGAAICDTPRITSRLSPLAIRRVWGRLFASQIRRPDYGERHGFRKDIVDGARGDQISE